MVHSTVDNTVYSKAESWKMFNRISRRYDLLNRVLSFGRDVLWRQQLSLSLPQKQGLEILDLATGTSDVLLFLFEKNRNIKMAYGIDMATKMIEVGREKIRLKNLNDRIILKEGDINQITFPDNTFDVITIAFGIRNIDQPSRVLSEMRRVLKKEGRVLVLEFSIPSSLVVKKFYLFYLRHIVPLVGFLISRDYHAYRYLNETVEAFPCGAEFCQMMSDAGFKDVSAHPLTYGIATIYQGDKY